MKYLIIGASGLIGGEFYKILSDKNRDVIGTFNAKKKENFINFNIEDIKSIRPLLNRYSPDVLINCLGLSGGVNFCEDNPEKGREYHVESTEEMVNWCKKNDASFLFISTDYVFDGTNPPYKENDRTNPLNHYGRLKLEAENYIKNNLINYIIARTTNVYGYDPDTNTPNFLMQLYRALKKGDTFNVPSFLYGNPTYANDLAKAMLNLYEKKAFGLYHIVGDEYINRYNWASKFCKLTGFDKNLLINIRNMPEMSMKRPLKSNLNNSKIKAAIDIKFKAIMQGMESFIVN